MLITSHPGGGCYKTLIFNVLSISRRECDIWGVIEVECGVCDSGGDVDKLS